LTGFGANWQIKLSHPDPGGHVALTQPYPKTERVASNICGRDVA
jgi:hypothetical protein